jgi:surface carbohydrate biosynthesis protein
MATKGLLLIPAENQVRELDSKLLLACIALRRGFSCVIGSRREMEFSIDTFPEAIYLSKSMTVRSLLFFRVANKFGHRIITWDEEALVHLPPETYFSRRLDPRAIQYVSHLFAWGHDNAGLWRMYPALPEGTPIHVTGNPRGDMLRPEIRTFYQDDVDEIRQTYGDFILVNTNFNHVNAFGPDLNLFKPVSKPGEQAKFGRAARGMSRAYAENLKAQKRAVFEDFKRLIPSLEQVFPNYTIVVRPHPTENHQVYRDIAAQCQRVQVTNEGNVIPWLMATRAVIHNGCTTGVEAYVMGVPAISYRASVNEEIDNGFYRLPHQVSHQCFKLEALLNTLQQILVGELGVADGEERKALVDEHLAGQDGPLACERMMDVLEQIARDQAKAPGPSLRNSMERKVVTAGLHLAKRVKSRLPGSHNRPEFQRHRYPGIPREALKARVARMQQVLGDDQRPRIEQISDVMFQLHPK